MKEATYHLMEQLLEATNTARDSGRSMYVFFADDQWWYSGQIPDNASAFYVAYPNGQIDSGGKAQEITPSDWNEFFEHSKEVFSSPFRPAKRQKEGWIKLSTQKKIFIGYCGFAPHLVVFFTAFLSWLLGRSFDFGLAFVAGLVVSPVSLIFCLISLYRPKDGRRAAFAALLATDAHLMIYFHLMMIHAKELTRDPTFAFTTMASMILTGIALLLIWDNEKRMPALISELLEA